MGIRKGQGYGSTKPKRTKCPGCGKQGVKGWRPLGVTGKLIHECQYCFWNEVLTPTEYELRVNAKLKADQS
jgi:hypothetical protein